MLLNLVCNTKTGITWEIDTTEELMEEDYVFIKKFLPCIYHNDLECYFWAFAHKLPSGKWLENIRFTNDLKTAAALIV